MAEETSDPSFVKEGTSVFRFTSAFVMCSADQMAEGKVIVRLESWGSGGKPCSLRKDTTSCVCGKRAATSLTSLCLFAGFHGSLSLLGVQSGSCL